MFMCVCVQHVWLLLAGCVLPPATEITINGTWCLQVGFNTVYIHHIIMAIDCIHVQVYPMLSLFLSNKLGRKR